MSLQQSTQTCASLDDCNSLNYFASQFAALSMHTHVHAPEVDETA